MRPVLLSGDHARIAAWRNDQAVRRTAARRPDLLHPNLPTVRLRPWGAREFALLDSTTVCVVVRQWPDAPHT